MRILFIHLVPPESRKVYHGFHHGIGCLSACLKLDSHVTSLFETDRLSKESLTAELKRFSPDVIALSSASAQIPLMEKVAEFLPPDFKGMVFAGGLGPMVEPERVLKFAGVTGVCIGEGEGAFRNLLKSIEKGKDFCSTENFIFRKDGGLIRNSLDAPAVLDELPFPDRSIFPMKDFLVRFGSLVGMEFIAGRGCPYHCTYCGNDFLNALYKDWGGFHRVRSVGSVIEEILEVKRAYGDFPLIGFHDDIFAVPLSWLEEFSRQYSSKVGVPFWCNQRADVFDVRRGKLLKRAGCIRVHIAIESGSARLRKELLARNISDEEIIGAFAAARSLGMRTVSFNIIGLPGETEDDIMQTIGLNRKIRPDWLLYSIFHPFPGTPLYDLCREKGYIGRRDAPVDYYSADWSIDSPFISKERLFDIYENFTRLVYKN